MFSLTNHETDGAITANYENDSMKCVATVQIVSIFLDVVVGLRGLEFDHDHMMATLSYYGRLIVWNIILLLLEDGFKRIPQATVSALNSIILFSLLLILLVYLKICKPKMYEDFRWFCTPSIIFLKVINYKTIFLMLTL